MSEEADSFMRLSGSSGSDVFFCVSVSLSFLVMVYPYDLQYFSLNVLIFFYFHQTFLFICLFFSDTYNSMEKIKRLIPENCSSHKLYFSSDM